MARALSVAARPRPASLGADALAAAAALVPFWICLLSGLVHASLWLDEIMYFYMEGDVALRAAEVGRPTAAAAPWLGVFFYCDVQKAFHALVRPLGFTFTRDPELYLRLPSLIAFGIAAVALAVFARRWSGRTLDGVLVGGAFGSLPIILHHAFEARVYMFTTLLVVLVGIAVHVAARKPSALRLTTAAGLSLVAAHSQFWTACLFIALAAVAVFDVGRARRRTAWATAAATAALPSLCLIALEFLYLRATDPGTPLFPQFQRLKPFGTLAQFVFSNFYGVLRTQSVVGEALATAAPAYLGGLALVGVMASLLWNTRGSTGWSETRLWAATVAVAFSCCWLLAVTYGYFTNARYHVPLLGGLFVATAIRPSRTTRLLLGLVLAVDLALLPTTIRAIEAKANVKQIAAIVQESGRRDLTVVCQHVVTSGYPAPYEAIGLDLYLNVLHPDEPPVRILDLPDLNVMNGRRGMFDLLNGGEAMFANSLRSTPDVWKEKIGSFPDRFYLLKQYWNIRIAGRQADAFARVVLESPGRVVVRRLMIPGFPDSELVEFAKRSGP